MHAGRADPARLFDRIEIDDGEGIRHGRGQQEEATAICSEHSHTWSTSIISIKKHMLLFTEPYTIRLHLREQPSVSTSLMDHVVRWHQYQGFDMGKTNKS